MKRRCIVFLSAVICIFACCKAGFAADITETETAFNAAAEYIYRTVENPAVGSVGGEWAIIGLARSEADVPDGYYAEYYRNVTDYVKERGGILHDKKYTEYSRVILALTAIGKNPADVAGYNLLTPLGDYDKTIQQGLNGPIWALIALDSGNYEMPKNSSAKTQATRDMYIDRILECQLDNGGFSLFGGTETSNPAENTVDPDITGMALQALAKYQNRSDVRAATDKALECLSRLQNDDGGYFGWGTESSESVVQIITALCELNIPIEDVRFVKNGNTLLDKLLTFYVKDSGFLHTADGNGADLMATEQALYGLTAVRRMQTGKNSLYSMSDCRIVPDQTEIAVGTESAVNIKPVTKPDMTFTDISGHLNREAVEALAEREIINGVSEDTFAPDATMTRAEFAAVTVRALSLDGSGSNAFTDVKESDWFFEYVNTAYAYGIVNGTSSDTFLPDGIITREEAAVMLARSAALCGMQTDMEYSAAKDILAVFTDYIKISDWAFAPAAFCVNTGIISGDAMEMEPGKSVTRAEIAQMLFNMLREAALI